MYKHFCDTLWIYPYTLGHDIPVMDSHSRACTGYNFSSNLPLSVALRFDKYLAYLKSGYGWTLQGYLVCSLWLVEFEIFSEFSLGRLIEETIDSV
ncbi:hypothetical protein [Shewanella waksmanii]|uniref:hypothetical protein n=1 Tax=Shewanella waksmanii TaxID=213783 RepID=UPI0037358F30